MDVLIEVHDAAELDRARQLESPLIGVNNRDLTTLTVDLGVTEELAEGMPRGRLLISESGLYEADDLKAGAEMAAKAIDSGAAEAALEAMVRISNLGEGGGR